MWLCGLTMATRFFSAGWEFSLSPFHPPDEVRVEAEAGNGCATWEIIQLSDQRGHTRGLITSGRTAGRPVRRRCVSASHTRVLKYCLYAASDAPFV